MALLSLLALSTVAGSAQDNIKSQTKLGTDYLLGRGVEQDRDQGFKLIRGAAEKGEAAAQRILGHLFWAQGIIEAFDVPEGTRGH